MDFVLGPEPKHWDTGKAPPSPATEAAAMVPLKPAPHEENHHRKKMLRDIGLAIMSLGLVSLIAATAATIWWFRFKKQKAAVTPEVVDQEKGEQALGASKGDVQYAASERSNSPRGWKAQVLDILGKRKPDATARPTSKRDSRTTTSSSEDGQSSNQKKELSIETLRPLDPAPVEPWTPRGTNRRDE